MGKPRVHISKEELEKLYLKEGRSAVQVAVILNCTSTSIKNYLIKYGLPVKGQSQIMKGRKLTPEHRDKVIKTLKYGKKGYENPNWKGGKVQIGRKKDGLYLAVRSEGVYHPEHRFVIENDLGRKLKRSEEVHHLNGNKQDNRLVNLIILSKSDHAKLHNADPKLRKIKSDKLKKARAENHWSTRK